MKTEIFLPIFLIVFFGTQLTRFIPFLFSPNQSYLKKGKFITDILPTVLILFLVIYCLRDIENNFNFWSKIFSGLLVVATHVKYKNFVMSVLSGTLMYIALVNLV